MQGREGECVIVQMLAVSSSLQTGDPGLETGHLRLLQAGRKKKKKKFTDTLPYCNFHYTPTLLKNSTLMSRDSVEVSMEAWS